MYNSITRVTEEGNTYQKVYNYKIDRQARQIGKQCSWIAIRLPALLVEGIPQAPMNAEFHSAAARPLDAFIRLRIAPNMTFEGSVPLTAKKNREANLLPAFLAGFSLFFSPLDPTGKQTLTGKEIVSGCDDGTF